jgi:hypothetical protein
MIRIVKKADAETVEMMSDVEVGTTNVLLIDRTTDVGTTETTDAVLTNAVEEATNQWGEGNKERVIATDPRVGSILDST